MPVRAPFFALATHRRIPLLALAAPVFLSCSSDGNGHGGPDSAVTDGGTGGSSSLVDHYAPEDHSAASGGAGGATGTATGGASSAPGAGADGSSASGGTPGADAASEADAGTEATTVDTGAPDVTQPDVDAGTSLPPELRIVQAQIHGDFPSTLDLTTQDGSYVLPRSTTVEFVVFARDDRTTVSALNVSVVNQLGVPLLIEQTSFSGGLFHVTVGAARGTTLRARVVDGDGNVSLSHLLVFPFAEDTVQGTWITRFFGTTQTVLYRWTSTWAGSDWTETRKDSGLVHGGTFAFSGDFLGVTETFAQSDAGVSASGLERRAAFFLDGTYFSDRPWERTAGTTGVVGSFQRTYELRTPADAGSAVVESATEVLDIRTDGTWSSSKTGTRTVPDGGTAPISESEAGTYRTDLNTNYSTGTVYFLGRVVTDVNGSPVTPGPERLEVYAERGPFLLLSPMQR